MKLFIELLHAPSIEGNQTDENVDRALVGHPKTEFKSTDLKVVELVDKEDRAAEGDKCPDKHQADNQT